MTELEIPRRKVGAPTETSEEKLIDEMTAAVKANADVSVWKKNRKISPLLTLITHLDQIPKTLVPPANLTRVRNQILDRISIPALETNPGWFATMFPRMLRISIGALGSLLIIASLALGTAVVALESGPGQAIYPLKKIVENIELKLAPADQTASLQLKFANNRVDEIQQVLENQSQGKVSSAEAQKAISQTVKDLQKNTSAAALAADNQPKVVSKLTDLSNKLQSASIQTEGAMKVELEQALESTRISQQEAIKNIENAGLKVENQPIIIDNSVTASGKLTAITDTSISIGTAKFLIDKDTVYVKTMLKDLKIDQVVDIEAQVKDNKTYATKITLISDTKTQESPVAPDNSASQ